MGAAWGAPGCPRGVAALQCAERECQPGRDWPGRTLRAVADKRETDAELAQRSANFLDTVKRMRELEGEKRRAARSSDEFHEMADAIEETARAAFRQAQEQNLIGQEDSPDPREREEQYEGDWTRSQRG